MLWPLYLDFLYLYSLYFSIVKHSKFSSVFVAVYSDLSCFLPGRYQFSNIYFLL